ncbi:hypothetical protein DUNSADRAFT_3614 [Dunaliella salina]|uniref:Encoded protein n=1 Tax=Dunaliella salina TaxID=3046 RepID=A0ABQ7FV99_DUNSA|nr:hypothetical protein DUNSADRAFT_3614 [Dunaliella salina]|eukprot:KAF5826314.1 hypothetical protein DUNSADRAFT_3614 [Dunaliella salina]
MFQTCSAAALGVHTGIAVGEALLHCLADTAVQNNVQVPCARGVSLFGWLLCLPAQRVYTRRACMDVIRSSGSERSMCRIKNADSVKHAELEFSECCRTPVHVHLTSCACCACYATHSWRIVRMPLLMREVQKRASNSHEMPALGFHVAERRANMSAYASDKQKRILGCTWHLRILPRNGNCCPLETSSYSRCLLEQTVMFICNVQYKIFLSTAPRAWGFCGTAGVAVKSCHVSLPGKPVSQLVDCPVYGKLTSYQHPCKSSAIMRTRFWPMELDIPPAP